MTMMLAPAYSTFTVSARPSSCRICRSSAARPFADSAGTVTENSSPILRSEPDRSFGRIFVPKRFQTSGGTLPETQSVRVEVLGPGTGTKPGSGIGAVGGPGSGSGVGSGKAGRLRCRAQLCQT